MLKLERGSRLSIIFVALAGLALSPIAFADDADDVLAVVKQYADLEENLQKQAELIRDDRVMVTNVRQSDQAKNLAIQLADRKANEAVSGGKTRFITTVESPQVAVYGNVAVVSFVRMFSVYPHEQAPVQTEPTWVTLVLVKDRGAWGIAHTHVSATGDN